MEDEKRRIVSKFISKILRYQPKEFNISFSEKGYCKLEELCAVIIQRSHIPVTEEEICFILLNSKWNGEEHRYDVWKGYVRAAYIPTRKRRITQ